MFSKMKLTYREKCELEEYRGTGLSPRQIRSLQRKIAEQRDYIDWLEEL